jgi:hypothetical protein
LNLIDGRCYEPTGAGRRRKMKSGTDDGLCQRTCSCRKTVAASFETKPPETVTTDFEAKLAKTVRVVLGPNHSQTIDLGFEAQPRNLRSSSPRARCRPHTTPPDLSIAWPPSTRPVRPSPVLCTRSHTPAMILVAARHVAPATCTPQDKQTRFSK